MMTIRKKTYLLVLLIFSIFVNSGFISKSLDYLNADDDNAAIDDINTCIVDQPDVLKIVFPEAMPFMLDPLGLKSENGIYSEKFTVYNYSKNDAVVKLSLQGYALECSDGFDPKDINIFIRATYVDGKGKTHEMDIPISDNESSGVYSFILQMSNYDELDTWSSFNNGSTLSLEIMGSINPMEGLINPINWDELNLMFNVNFSARLVIPENILSEPSELDLAFDNEYTVPVDTPPESDIVFPEPEIATPPALDIDLDSDDINPEPPTIMPPESDIVFPEPEVVTPSALNIAMDDLVFPEPEVITPSASLNIDMYFDDGITYHSATPPLKLDIIFPEPNVVTPPALDIDMIVDDVIPESLTDDPPELGIISPDIEEDVVLEPSADDLTDLDIVTPEPEVIPSEVVEDGVVLEPSADDLTDLDIVTPEPEIVPSDDVEEDVFLEPSADDLTELDIITPEPEIAPSEVVEEDVVLEPPADDLTELDIVTPEPEIVPSEDVEDDVVLETPADDMPELDIVTPEPEIVTQVIDNDTISEPSTDTPASEFLIP